MTPIRFDVPMRVKSTANLREHWAAKHKRVDAQKAKVRRSCPRWDAGPLLVVRLTRVAPRRLDDDNLAAALKSVRDAVATWLRVDDASPLVRWVYAQERCTKGSESVRVEVMPPSAAPAAGEADALLRAYSDSSAAAIARGGDKAVAACNRMDPNPNYVNNRRKP